MTTAIVITAVIVIYAALLTYFTATAYDIDQEPAMATIDITMRRLGPARGDEPLHATAYVADPTDWPVVMDAVAVTVRHMCSGRIGTDRFVVDPTTDGAVVVHNGIHDYGAGSWTVRDHALTQIGGRP